MRLVYAIINFLLLAGLLFLVGRKPVLRMFRARRERIKADLHDAEEGQRTAQLVDGVMAEQRARSQERLEKSVAAAEAQRQSSLEQIGQESDNVVALLTAEGQRGAAGQRLEMLRRTRSAAIRRVAEEARTALRQEPFASQFRARENELADAILEQVHITPGCRVYLRRKGVLYVTLTSAYPLAPELSGRIRQAAEALLKPAQGKISWRELVDPDMVGGLKLRVGDMVYDATIDSILWTLEKHMAREPLRADMDADALEESILSGIREMTHHLDVYQQGRALSVSDGICWMDGLSDTMYGELVEFECGERGMILSVEPDRIACVVFGAYERIQELSKVRRLGWMADVPVGEGLLGRVVDPLGAPLDGKGALAVSEYRPVESPAPAILDRQGVNVPLHTGIKAVDALIPIGRGQRELIIGDRQTGKTALAVDTILNQRGENVICIYVAIDQKETSVAGVMNVLEKHGALDYTIIVCADAYQSAPMRYIAPYAGAAMGEYFMNKGRDVLIVYDDLSKHAIAYREMSLLLHRPSGREAYPGDVFYLHSRLLERAARLSAERGGGSMTALPIVETQDGDISAYIPTNVISITDGQIFLESDLFREGQRPAVNVGLSVSRVGGAAQLGAMRQVAGRMRMDLAQYRELAAFSQFGADLDQSTQDTLSRGKRLTAVLRQRQYDPIPVAEQVLALFAVARGFADDVPPENIGDFEEKLRLHFRTARLALLEMISSGKKLTPEQLQKLEDAISEYRRSATA